MCLSNGVHQTSTREVGLKLAFITPTNYLETVAARGDIHLVLAHLVLKDEKYREFYKNSKTYKILDNGAFELGQPMHIEDILKAAEMIGADEVVAPDVFNDGRRTLEAVHNFTMQVKTLLPAFKKIEHKFKIMAVPHGKNFLDWLKCFEELYLDDRIDVIGIGYKSCKVFTMLFSTRDYDLSTTRTIIVNRLTQLFPKKTIHLLGGGTNANEVEMYKYYPQVRSMDTCFPFLCGQHGVLFDKVNGAERPEKYRELDFNTKDLTSSQLKDVIYNCDMMLDWTRTLAAVERA